MTVRGKHRSQGNVELRVSWCLGSKMSDLSGQLGDEVVSSVILETEAQVSVVSRKNRIRHLHQIAVLQIVRNS